MPHHSDSTRLSGGDALFLHLEREGMPLNVASVNVFEGLISLPACVRFIESKLPLIPRYRQRVVSSPFNISLPKWEYDPDFDIRNHVREVTLKRGTEADFKNVAGKILSQMMDRQRPLWDFTLVRRLRGNRTAVVTRMHHCMADGLAGVSLLNALMDPSPEIRPLPAEKPQFHVPHRRSSPASLLDELIASTSSVAQRILTAQTELLHVVQQVLAAASQRDEESSTKPHSKGSAEPLPSTDQFARFMLELGGTTQRLPFNIICRGPQKFDWAEIPLAEIKAVKQACGATVNDVVLTIMTSAMQRYVEQQGVRVRGRLLRIVVPVNMRGNGNAKELGNRITFLPMTIPLDIRNLRKLLLAIRERMAFLKGAHVAELIGMAGTVLATLPTAAQAVVGPIVSQLPLGLCNTICTNVPGPAFPLYLLGHKMLHCYPYVPIGGDIGINCAVLTYDGTAYFGFSGDAHAAPDLGRLSKFLTTAFVELQRSTGTSPSRRRAARRKPRPSKSSGMSASIPPSAKQRGTESPVLQMPAQSPPEPVAKEAKPNELLRGLAV
jgi:diacylglycerol O-acyltransferase / wax synthase